MINIIQGSATSVLHKCMFGFHDLHACSYNISNPPIYFSLGEAVGAVALFIAAYQLSKPSWRITFSIRKKWQRLLPLTFLIAGLIMILLSSLVMQVPFYILKNPFNYPIFYETLGFLFFLIAPTLYVFFSMRSKGLFNKDTYEDFFQQILHEVSRATPETLEASINIISNNLSELAKSAKKEESIVFIGEEIEKKSSKSPDRIYANYAANILNIILSEKKVANYIATARLDFLLHFISEIKKNNLERTVGLASESITSCLFEDKNSHLYNQLNHGGLSISANLYKAIFFDQDVLNNINPFSEWNTWLIEDESLLLQKRYLDVYLRSLKDAVEGYWFYGEGNIGRARMFYYGFKNLTDYSRRIIYLASQDLSKKKVVFERLHKIASFIGDDFMQIYEKALKDGLVKDYDIKVTHHDEHRITGCSQTAYYVNMLVDFLETLSMIEDDNDNVWHATIEATEKIVGVVIGEGEAFKNLRDDFFSLAWGKIFDNVERGHFPAFLRVYLPVMVFDFSNEDLCMERNKLITYMEDKLIPKILAGEKMINKKSLMEEILLPENIIFNRKTNKFCNVDRDGEKNELNIKPCGSVVEIKK
ncbi:MAG: hypothetical protein WC823_06510 [Parcubacteria group bacterium]|jgi:hypothetical protein